uniref:Uncharacterized protein n=1 Tax=Oryza barthii TaxID=65489 RepID=A0A0D3G5M7_9ORYZ
MNLSTSSGRIIARDPCMHVRAKEGDKESYLVDNVEPLPILLTVLETKPILCKELDGHLSLVCRW